MEQSDGVGGEGLAGLREKRMDVVVLAGALLLGLAGSSSPAERYVLAPSGTDAPKGQRTRAKDRRPRMKCSRLPLWTFPHSWRGKGDPAQRSFSGLSSAGGGEYFERARPRGRCRILHSAMAGHGVESCRLSERKPASFRGGDDRLGMRVLALALGGRRGEAPPPRTPRPPSRPPPPAARRG